MANFDPLMFSVLQYNIFHFTKSSSNVFLLFDVVCFELIHKAFDKAFRIPENFSKKDKTIFYHLHNPTYFERASFHYHYPDSKSLFIIRHPIQMLESWLLADLNSLPSLLEENPTFSDNYQFIEILNCGDKIAHSLEYR